VVPFDLWSDFHHPDLESRVLSIFREYFLVAVPHLDFVAESWKHFSDPAPRPVQDSFYPGCQFHF
jgi:hypothetical protein